MLLQNSMSLFETFIFSALIKKCRILVKILNTLKIVIFNSFKMDLYNKSQRFLMSVFVLDAAVPYQLGLQDQASRAMLAIVDFHDDLMFMMHLVFFFVLVLLMRTLVLFSASNGQSREGNTQEPFQDLMGTTSSKNSFIHGLRAICLKCRYHFSHHTRLEVY